MKASITHRQFAQRSTLAAGSPAVPIFAPSGVVEANGRLDVADIGADGKGEVQSWLITRRNVMIELNAKNMRASNTSEANCDFTHNYRVGWKL